jgi:hypothetical protein
MMMMMMMMMIVGLFGQLGLWAPSSGVCDVFTPFHQLLNVRRSLCFSSSVLRNQASLKFLR